MHSLVLRASVYQLPIRSIRSLLQTRRFQTSFLTEMVSQSRPVFASAASTTPAHDTKNSLTGISSSTSERAVNWGMPAITSRRGTGNWVSGIRETRGRTFPLARSASPPCGTALLDTDPRTAFNPFLGINGMNSGNARGAVYVTLHNSGAYELPIYYGTFNGDLFNLPAGPVSFAIGGEYDAPRFTRDRDALNNTFSSIGSVDGQSFKVNRDIWGVYEEVRVPFTSPTWNFWGFYSFEVDFAEREEWYSTNTSAVLPSGLFPAVPAQHTKYNAQKPKVSIRWQPMDPKYIGAVTLRGSYTEAFHAPTLSEVTPASSQNFPIVADPFSSSDRATGRGASHW